MSWIAMKSRCLNPNHVAYESYKGKLCDRWLVFENFLCDMGERPDREHSIERVDNDGRYEPGNCRWATAKEQQRNKRNTRKLVVGGTEMALPDAAELAGISRWLVHKRLRRGWTGNKALSSADFRSRDGRLEVG
jgi:hypothetical protein